VLQAHSPDVVAVFAADHVYRMDVRQMVDFHRSREADATVAAVGVPLEKASSFGIITAARTGRVREFHEKPRRAAPSPRNPAQAYASMGNYLFDPLILERALEEWDRTRRNRFRPPPAAATVQSGARLCYDFAQNQVPGNAGFEEPAVLARRRHAHARSPPRSRTPWGIGRAFNLWNRPLADPRRARRGAAREAARLAPRGRQDSGRNRG
jgi:hypothetical protein